MYQKIFLMSSHSCSVVKILLRTGVYLVFCGCSGCSARTDTELTTISCFSDADSFTGFVKEQRWSLYNPTRFWARFSCKNCISAAAIMFPLGTLERQEHALRQTQTSRTKACSQAHMTYFSLCCFVFGVIPTLNSLPLSISGQDLYRRERAALRSNVGKIITEAVMLLAAIIVRRHLPALCVLVCTNPVMRWTAEGNSGLGFHQKRSSID